MKQTFTSARRPLEILIHIISWGIMFGFPFFFVERGNGNINWMAYTRHLAVPLSFMIVFYVNYFILVPRYLFQSQAKRYVVYNIIFLCAIGVLLHLWQSLTFDPSFAPKSKRPGMPPGWLFFLRDMLSLVFTIGLSAAIRMSARWTQNEAARKEAERNRAEAELKNLRNQLNPHFLLNTLNNIYALIAFDSDKAQQAVQELSKLKAYEHGEMEERLESRNRAIGQLGDMFDREIAGTEDGTDFDLANPGGKEEKAQPATPQTIQSSAAAYRDLNATLGNFYEQPKNDNAEMDELLERIASLESELESEKGRTSSMDEQVALMEKSYELAAKYMGGQNGGKPEQAAEPSTVQKGKKNTATPVRQVTRQVVSSLAQPMSNAEFVATFSQERNRGFNTAVGTTEVSDRNTIPACVHGAQSVTDGQTVRLRLLEPMAVAGRTIPRNAVVVGTGKIQGERLDIEVTSLEYDGTIIPVELAVYDTDGQPGIFIPNSMEMNAVREVAANMGGSLGSSINISTNAGAQLASDLGKGLIQGTSQYIAKKMRTVKVHLKAGYRVMLYQEKD